MPEQRGHRPKVFGFGNGASSFLRAPTQFLVLLLTADGRRTNPSLTARTPVPTVRIAELAQPSEVGYRFCFRRPDLQVGASSFSGVAPSRPDDSEAARVFP